MNWHNFLQKQRETNKYPTQYLTKNPFQYFFFNENRNSKLLLLFKRYRLQNIISNLRTHKDIHILHHFVSETKFLHSISNITT